jgi:hypothetical protein
MAKGSAGEVRSMTYVAEDEAIFAPDHAQRLRDDCLRLSGAIATLAAYLRKTK